MSKLFIVTGEHSGDLHASYVVRELRKLKPGVEIEAIGGINLQNEGVKLFKDHSKMASFSINLKLIFDHLNLGKKLVNYMVNDYKPDAVLLIDYGGFNLRLAKELKKHNIKVYYYIPPQIWASRGGRIKSVKKYVDKVFYIFPFEKELYEKNGIECVHVGHPLISQMPEPYDKEIFFKENGLDINKKLVGIFPGSRKGEIENLAGIFKETADLIKNEVDDVQFCISQAPNLDDEYIEKKLKGFDIKILKHKNYDIMASCDCLILASGTVSLEAALYETPMVISYIVSPVFYVLYLIFRYLKWISLPNIILEKGIIKEFKQNKAKPDLIAGEVIGILKDDNKKSQMIADLKLVKEKLTDKKASLEVAKEIEKVL